MIGALNELCVAGRSIEELSRDDKVLRRWQLAPGSLMLLRTILDSREGHAEFVSCGDSLQHSLSMLCVDLKAGVEEDEDYDDDFETDDDADSGVNLETAAFEHQSLQAPWSPPEEAVSMSTSFSPHAAECRPQPAAVAPAPRQTIDTPPPLTLGSSQRKLGLEAKQMLDSALDMPGRCSEERRELPALFFLKPQHTSTWRRICIGHTARHILQGHWKLGKCIGQGSFGAVYTCLDEATGQLMAVKMMAIPTSELAATVDGTNFHVKDRRSHSAQSELRALCSEIELMRSFEHPNIVRYLGATVDEPNLQLCIFQEWVPGGSLANLLTHYGAFAESVIRQYTTHILEGLVYLHANHIIHRDIKCGNVLVDEDGVAKLADFGASHRLGKDGTLTADMKLTTMRGTPYFIAPEVLLQDKFGRRSDVWSTGGVVLQMATTSAHSIFSLLCIIFSPQNHCFAVTQATTDPPWKCMRFSTPMALFYHVASTTEPPPIDQYNLSSSLRAFILRCFERDPQRRPHAVELRQDPFLVETNQDHDQHQLDDELQNTLHRIERVTTPAVTAHTASSSRGNLQSLKMRMSLRGTS